MILVVEYADPTILQPSQVNYLCAWAEVSLDEEQGIREDQKPVKVLDTSWLVCDGGRGHFVTPSKIEDKF